ncbi:MAG: protease inhibitor I42 family protein [Candidatus Paceibacterota bacterium]
MENKKTLIFFVIAVVIVLGLIIFSDKSDIPAQTGEKDIQTNIIQTTNGEEFIVELDSNPSTGYTWVYDFDKEYVTFIEKLNKKTFPQQIEGAEIVSAPIQEVFKFKVLKTGETKINFYYLREWEIDVAPIDQKAFDVIIK